MRLLAISLVILAITVSKRLVDATRFINHFWVPPMPQPTQPYNTNNYYSPYNNDDYYGRRYYYNVAADQPRRQRPPYILNNNNNMVVGYRNKYMMQQQQLHARIGLSRYTRPPPRAPMARSDDDGGQRNGISGDRSYSIYNTKDVNKRDWRYWRDQGPYQYGENLEQMQDDMVNGVEDDYMRSSAVEHGQEDRLAQMDLPMLPPPSPPRRRRYNTRRY